MRFIYSASQKDELKINFEVLRRTFIFDKILRKAMQNFKQNKIGKKGAVKFSKVWNV